MSQNQTFCLEQLREKIESELSWGEREQWSNRDFDELSERILARTKVSLSTTTLKRVWGKVAYASQPSRSTLNALAQFAGFESWQMYVGQLPQSQTIQFPAQVENQSRPTDELDSFSKPAKKPWGLLSLCLIVVLGGGLWFQSDWPMRRINPGLTHFSSKAVSSGLPNTVIFSYDVSQLSAGKVEIQQSWDERLRQVVDKDGSIFTTTYYYPGYYRAKLLVEGQIVKEHDVYVRSNGWLAIADAEPIPRYLSGDWGKEGYFSVPDAWLGRQEWAGPETVARISYSLVQDFGELSASNFSLETRLRHDSQQSQAVCQNTEVIIQCSRGHFWIPFSIPGCVGTLRLHAGEVRLSGETNDLSAFGCELSDWQSVRISVQEKCVSVFRNEHLIYQTVFQRELGKVVGLRYRFLGTGSIDEVRLHDEENELVFEEVFGK